MTKEEINVAICTALGNRYHKPTPEEIASGSYYQYEPDYFGSLDEMSVAEKTLTADERACYCSILEDAVQHGSYWYFITATAPQRAEAWLRTKGLWED